MNTIQLPLFPLHTVLFPGGPLPLRVFEARYLDMISACMRNNSGFGVCLIIQGKEVGAPATTHPFGTVAYIHDWHMRHDGLLGVTARGERRFKVASVSIEKNQLAVAKAELLAPEPEVELPNRFLPLADILRKLLEHAGHHYEVLPRRFADAGWVSCRLAELLPIGFARQQSYLEMDDPLQRLEALYGLLEGMEVC